MLPQRVAACLSLVAFALCLLIGGFGADNGFGVTVGRAMLALVGTYIVALVIGHMAKRMLDENVAAAAGNGARMASTKSPEKSEAK